MRHGKRRYAFIALKNNGFGRPLTKSTPTVLPSLNCILFSSTVSEALEYSKNRFSDAKMRLSALMKMVTKKFPACVWWAI